MKTQEELNEWKMTAAYRALLDTATWTDGETFVHIAATVENLRYGYAMEQFVRMQCNPLDFAIKWPALTAALIDNYLDG